MKKELPILFSTPMVQAILGGRKTMTRRIVKPKYSNTDFEWREDKNGKRLMEIQNDVPPPVRKQNPDGSFSVTHKFRAVRNIPCPYKTGNILWVRETMANLNMDFPNLKPHFVYKADMEHPDQHGPVTWKPSIFMPKPACRIWLEVTDVRVERLHNISEEDAISEGVANGNIFRSLWQQINGNWEDNPWVWVVSFKVLSTTGKPSER